MESDAKAVNSAADKKDAAGTKAALEESVKDLKGDKKLATKDPKIEQLIDEVIKELEAEIEKFAGPNAPFAEIDALNAELAKKLKATSN